MSKLAILGAGSWGLTLAWLACKQKHESVPSIAQQQVVLWTRNSEKAAELNANRNVSFPVEVTLPESIVITDDLEFTIRDADAILLVVTSNATVEMARRLVETGCLNAKSIVVNASKGLDSKTLRPLSQSLAEVLPANQPIAVMSGPTLAKEILNDLPTACAIASDKVETAEFIQAMLSCRKRFRLYTNTDVLGVELGGALKNVFAIASGFMQAKAIGENARAALITRGLAEMTRLSLAMGADAETLYGLSGLGDLLATCYSPLSRNFQVGYRLAQGQNLEAIQAEMKVVAEGIHTAYVVSELSKSMGIDTPIVNMVLGFMEGRFISEEAMIQHLMSRKLKAESPVC